MQRHGFYLHGHDGWTRHEVDENTGGKLQVAAPSDRSRKSLEDLGLDVLMEIDPQESSWRDSMESIRAKLVACKADEEKKVKGSMFLMLTESCVRQINATQKNLVPCWIIWRLK